MQKILVTACAIAALGYLAYRALYKYSDTAAEDAKADLANREASAPKQTLNNVRAKAADIEAKDQAYADKIAEDSASP